MLLQAVDFRVLVLSLYKHTSLAERRETLREYLRGRRLTRAARHRFLRYLRVVMFRRRHALGVKG